MGQGHGEARARLAASLLDTLLALSTAIAAPLSRLAIVAEAAPADGDGPSTDSQDANPLATATDIETYCADTPIGEGRILACLRASRDDISSGRRTALAETGAD